LKLGPQVAATDTTTPIAESQSTAGAATFTVVSRRTLAHVAIIAGIAITAGWLGIDLVVYRSISERLSTPDPIGHSFYNSTRTFWETVREFGSVGGAVVAFVGLFLVHSRSWRVAMPTMIAVFVADGAGFLLQGLIGRLRPNHSIVEGASGWFPHLQFLVPPQGLIGNTPTCFPSGEATAAFALATALSACWPKAAWLWYLLATLVGVARIVHGSHFFSDVVAGGLLGFTLTTVLLPHCATFVTRVVERFPSRGGSSRNN